MSFSARWLLALPLIACALIPSFSAGGTWVKRSTISNCPNGYVAVSAYTLPDNTAIPAFCVMKYEAKKSSAAPGNRNIEGTLNALSIRNTYPLSEPFGLPWVSLTWQDAKSACISSGATLITELQWLSIAHQVTSVPGNWTGGAVGNGSLYLGHTDSAPATALEASVLDADGYIGTNDSATAPGDGLSTGFTSNIAAAYKGQRRTLTLPNSNIIWDFSGNVSEWVDQSIAQSARYYGGASGWMSYTSNDGTGKIATNVLLAKRPPSPYNATHGMGRYFDGSNSTGAYNSTTESPDSCTSVGFCSATAAFLRGGDSISGANAGVFTLILEKGRVTPDANIGFRCVR